MTYAAVQDLLARFPAVEGPLDTRRIAGAYDDLEALAALHTRAAALADVRQIAAPTDERLAQAFDAGRTSDALHRAVIESGCIAVKVFIHECLGRPTREMSIPQFVSSRHAACLIAVANWSEVYRLATYRNKLVAHHDVAHMRGAVTDALGQRRLLPLPEEFHLLDPDVMELRLICSQLQMEPPDNAFELLDYTFHTVPVTVGRKQSDQRLSVDKIMARGGVSSFTVLETETMATTVLDDAERLIRHRADKSL